MRMIHRAAATESTLRKSTLPDRRNRASASWGRRIYVCSYGYWYRSDCWELAFVRRSPRWHLGDESSDSFASRRTSP